MLFALALACILTAMNCPTADADDTPVISLGEELPSNLICNNTVAGLTKQDGKPCIRVRFNRVDWPNIYFTPTKHSWDWSAYAGLAIDVYNPEREPISVCIRVDNAGADGINNCGTACGTADSRKWTTLKLWFGSNQPSPFWGMRGTPDHGPLPQSTKLDPSKITAFQIFLPQPTKEHTLLVSNIRLFGTARQQVPLPFVDRFGQYIHAVWPGKLNSEDELIRRRDEETRLLNAAPELPGRDKYGGWLDGPKLHATGWFRTQKIDGRWWLVTPEGRLFFSIGVDCVNFWDRTFIEKREQWFEQLPDPESEFKPAYGYAENVHSMAETIGGKGRTFNFYMANLMRKYGREWKENWRKTSYARLKAWGFNTIGNWSDPDVLANSPLPFTATASVWGDFRRIEGGGGYWNKMPDVYDPKFADAAEACIAPVAKRYAANPLCIGYFVDNELAWDAVERGVLASPPDQPCRVEMVRRLQTKYGSLDKLNKAWNTNASDWDSLRVPEQPNEVCRQDLNSFVHAFARRYFLIIKHVLRKHAPNQLYLGCRFAWSHKEAIRACAEVADVVSFNIYRTHVNCEEWTGANDLGKPIIIGEFHFGALDRGMFHPGLVPARNQDERAAAFCRYVRSVVDCPAFVGCHWFQYIDEPLTGRIYDGENYNIGLVDVTDTPYPELISAAKKVNMEIYARRIKKRPAL